MSCTASSLSFCVQAWLRIGESTLGSRPRQSARHAAWKENAKVRNRRQQRKFSGTSTKPRLSVLCSNRQLYAMLVDDHGKRTSSTPAPCRRPSAASRPAAPWRPLEGLGKSSSRRARRWTSSRSRAPQRLRSRGEDVGVRGSDLPAWVPAGIAEAWHGRLLALAVQSSRVFKED